MTDIYRLYSLINKSRKNILNMLNSRGYDVSNYINFTKSEMATLIMSHFNGKYESSYEPSMLDILLEKKDINNSDITNKIYIKYRLDEKFKKTDSLIKQINDIYTNKLSKDDTLIILYVNRIITKPGVKDKNDEEFERSFYVTKGYYVQLFGLENFLIDVSNHVSVPKHIIMNNDDVRIMMKDYNIDNLKQLPETNRSDVQCKYIGLRPNQVCKIQYKNLTTGKSVKYKICKF